MPQFLIPIALGILTALPGHAYELTGVVLDFEDAPVAGADVWLSQRRLPRHTRTDERGGFAFHDVAVGPVEVVGRKDGLALGGSRGQLIDDVKVTITLGEPDSIRLRMIDTQYEPVAGARLRWLEIDGMVRVSVEDLVELGFPSVRSDDDGFLLIEGLPKESFVSVTVGHRNYANTSLPALPTGIELDLPMPFGVKLRGRITNEAGEGVERARVSVFRPGTVGQYEFAETLSDPEGFSTAIAPPETYYVAVRHPDYAMPEPQAAELKENGEPAVLDFVLPAPHRVHGTTVDTSGRPVSLVKLSYRTGDIIYDETVSDASGEFLLTVASGDGMLHITPPERMMTVKYPQIGFRIESETQIDLDPIVLKDLPEARGRVTLSGNAPLDKVLIRSLELDPPIWTTTDAEGTFVIRFDRMQQGPARFSAEHALRFLRRDFEIDPRTLKSPKVALRTFRPKLSVDDEVASNGLDHMVGKPAPEIVCDAWFNLPGAQEEITLMSLRGKVVVLTLWGGFDTYGKTRHRINELNAIYRLLRDVPDVAIIAVHDASIEPPDIARYVDAFGIEFPVGCDADPFLTFDAYNTNVIPQTILIDKRGVLRYYKVDGHLLERIKDLRRR